jgi:hypothetical protein
MIVLAREDAGCNELIDLNGIKLLTDLLKSDSVVKNHDARLAITRIFASICKNSFKRVISLFSLMFYCNRCFLFLNFHLFFKSSKAKRVYNELQSELIAELISDKSEAISTAAGLIVQNMIYSLTDLDNKRRIKKQINETFDFGIAIFKHSNLFLFCFVLVFVFLFNLNLKMNSFRPRDTRLHRRDISLYSYANHGPEMSRLWSRQLH